MFLNLLSLLSPALISMAATMKSFHSFYENEPFFTVLLGIVSGLITFFAVIPVKPYLRLFFSLFGLCMVACGMYNFIFFVIMLALSFIFALLLPKRLVKRRLLFTPDNDFFVITYRPLSRKRSYFAHLSTTLLVVMPILLLFSSLYSSHSMLWNVRAFPISLDCDVPYKAQAVPSGMITCAVAYDDTAIIIDSFSAVETPTGPSPSPAQTAGIKQGDLIIKINGQRAKESDFITKGPDGSPAEFEILRFKEGTFDKIKLKVTPLYSVPDEKYMIGIYYYNSTIPGIYHTVQTVSFFYPDTGYFAATAHASEMPDAGSYIELLKTAENIGRDETGLTAAEGEIIGEILLSNRYGSFGIWQKAEGEALPLAKKSEVRLGRAKLLSSFEATDPEEYEVYVTGTYRIDGRDVICLIAPDERIIAFGGIARGMSGSPIIQNGKIIGALSNTDKDGYHAYATFASDMAEELYLAEDILKESKEAQK